MTSRWERPSIYPNARYNDALEKLIREVGFGKYKSLAVLPYLESTSQRDYLSFFNRKFEPSSFMFVELYYFYGIVPTQILELVERHVDKCDIDSHVEVIHTVLEKEGNLLIHQIEVVEFFHWTAGKEEDEHIWETKYIMGPPHEMA